MATETHFNFKLVRGYRLRRYLRRIIPLLCLFFLALGTAIYYLSNLPAERREYSRGMLSRVQNGVADLKPVLVSALTAPEVDINTTKLPIAEIYLQGSKIDQLNSSLPESGATLQNGLFKFEGKVYEARLRYRGDSLNHWLYPYKSWRIRLKDSKRVRNHSIFNLTVPRSPSQVSDYLGYQLAKEIGGLLVPEVDLMHFRLNREFNGLRMFLEQPTHGFAAKRGLPPGKILVGDVDTRKIYGPRNQRTLLFEKASAWEVIQPDIDYGVVDTKKTEPSIATLNKVLKTKFASIAERKAALEELVNFDDFANFLAYLELIGSWHIDNTHNQRLYLNPDTGKFSPIVWDPIAFFWPFWGVVDLPANKLAVQLLEIPEFRHKKNVALWRSLTQTLPWSKLEAQLRELKSRVRSEVEGSIYRISSEKAQINLLTKSDWENSYETMISYAKRRYDFLIPELQKTALTIASKNGRELQILALSHGGIRLKSITVNSKVPVRLTRSDGSLYVGERQNDGAYRFQLNHLLLSNKRYKTRRASISSASYRYTLSAPGEVSIEAYSELTCEPVKTQASAWKENSDLGVLVERTDSPKQVIKFTDGLKVDETRTFINQKVVISGDVHIAPRKSLVFQNCEVQISDSNLASSTNRAWGTIAFVDSKILVKRTNVSNGSYSTVGLVHYPAAIVVRNSTGQIEELESVEAPLAIENSLLTINNSKIEEFREHQSIVAKHNLLQPPRDLALKPPIGPAVGTPPRSEREYKYRFGGDLQLKRFAEEVNSALSKAVLDPSRFKASQIVDKNYSVSEPESEAAYVDYYFDTRNQDLIKSDTVARVRYRYKNHNQFFSYLTGADNPENWPYRLDIQVKADRSFDDTGFTAVTESRLEFRGQSSPFNQPGYGPPPMPPWNFAFARPIMKRGVYNGDPTTPGQLLATTLKKRGVIEPTDLEPKFVYVNRRYRQHLQLKTPWGSGPNPDQAFIITFDDTTVYPYEEIKNCEIHCVKAEKELTPSTHFQEMEIEFERNVSTKLDEAVADTHQAQEARDSALRASEAFNHDQSEILQVVSDLAQQLGVDISPASNSKFGTTSLETKKNG